MPAWFPVADGVQLPAIPTPVNGQITVQRAIPTFNEIVPVSTPTITTMVVTKFNYSLFLLTEITIASHTELGLTVIGTILPDTAVADIITPDSDTNSGSLDIDVPVANIDYLAPEIIHAGNINEVNIDSPVIVNIAVSSIDMPVDAPTLIWHFDGSQGSTSAVSTGVEVISATFYSDAALSTVQKKFGTASLYIAQTQNPSGSLQDPTVDRIEFTPTQKLGTEDWCIEFWWYPNPTESAAYCSVYSIAFGPTDDYNSFNASIDVDYSEDSIRQWFGFSGIGLGSGYIGTFTRNQWNHVAWYRVGLEYYLATNGIVDTLDKRTEIGPIEDFQDVTHMIGDYSGDGTYSLPGDYVDEVRITYGSSPYGSTNFTPPVAPFS